MDSTLCRVYIRWMIRRDMDEVLDIEDRSFGCAWTLEDFVRRLRQRNCIARVAEHEERVVGFQVYELEKHRINLLNLAVDPEFRRRGVGRQMIGELQRKISAQRRRRIVLDVDEHNDPAIAFFRALGFRGVGIVRDYYGHWSDAEAILMEYRHA